MVFAPFLLNFSDPPHLWVNLPAWMGSRLSKKWEISWDFCKFDFDCNKFWHRCVPADLEMPVGYSKSWFGVFCVNLFARRGMRGVICTMRTVGTTFLTLVPIKNTPLNYCTLARVWPIRRFKIPKRRNQGPKTSEPFLCYILARYRFLSLICMRVDHIVPLQ